LKLRQYMTRFTVPCLVDRLAAARLLDGTGWVSSSKDFLGEYMRVKILTLFALHCLLLQKMALGPALKRWDGLSCRMTNCPDTVTLAIPANVCSSSYDAFSTQEDLRTSISRDHLSLCRINLKTSKAALVKAWPLVCHM
jgi:hypothetical protein